MDDIFQQALSGNEAAIKGLYACSVASAYAALAEVVPPEQAVEMIKEIYISAFQGAKSYDAFFARLNKRAATLCKILLDKNVLLKPIEATQAVFVDVQTLEVPQPLKEFESTFCAISLDYLKTPAKKARVRKKGRGKKGEERSELEEFSELVKRHEFSAIEKAAPKPPPEPEKPKTIAQKLQSDESVISDEQLTKARIEREKNKRASLIAFIFAGIILIGSVGTYFLTGMMVQRKRLAQQSTTAVLTTLAEKKRYKAGEASKAFKDYLNENVLEKYPYVSTQRIVAYTESKQVGVEQLNGTVGVKQLDLDGDGSNEMVVVGLRVSARNMTYQYTFTASVYTFEERQVVPLTEEYRLLAFTVYNRAMDYSLCDFKLGIRLLKNGEASALYAYALSENMKVHAFHRFEQGELQEAERFVWSRWNNVNAILLQARNDGTCQPLFYSTNIGARKDCSNINEEQLEEWKDYGISLAGSEVMFDNESAALRYVKSLLKPFGCRLNKNCNAVFEKMQTEQWCELKAANEQGDKLSRREVVQLKAQMRKAKDKAETASESQTGQTTETATTP